MSKMEGVTWYTKLVTDSTAEPVSTSDIKRQVNLPSTFLDDDPWIVDCIKAARQYVERRIPGRRTLTTKSLSLVMDRFPYGDERIYFPHPPFSSVTSITYYDANNSSTTLASSDYIANVPYEQPAFIVPAIEKTWPTTQWRPDAVTIQYVAGYGAASTVPMTIKHAIKMLAAHWYENREAVVVAAASKEIEMAVESLLNSHSWGFYG